MGKDSAEQPSHGSFPRTGITYECKVERLRLDLMTLLLAPNLYPTKIYNGEYLGLDILKANERI
ncbi:MAG: hypothetical protein JW384_01499 [Nitrosomonadaceae bacterium]|nr:hypothetical protein [Nitrosomonadaceae bacterium]